MGDHKYLHGVSGVVAEIISTEKSLIMFNHGDVICKAVLLNERFYHNGKKITHLDEYGTKYIRIGLKVKFSCHLLDNAQEEGPMYYATVCWNHCEDPGRPPMRVGLLHTRGEILKISKRHGVITTEDNTLVYFIASKLYLFEKRMPSAKSLEQELSIGDKIFFDAIPCIASENEENCNWFATIVFKGKRPDIGEEKQEVAENDFNIMRSHEMWSFLNQYIGDSRKVFISGKGIFMKAISDEFGVIMGEFKKNIFQTILFHRKNLFAFKVNVGNEKIRKVLKEGDRLKFIVVDAPQNFITSWIAVQVAIDIPDDFVFLKPEVQGKDISLHFQ